MNGGSRLCTQCGAAQEIAEDERIWPIGWVCPACGTAVAAEDDIPLFAPALADTVTGMDPVNFAALAEVEQAHFWFVARNRLITRLIERFFPDARDLLEIGCGTAMVLSALCTSRHWRRVAGSDLHPSGLKIARERLRARPDVELVQMDARALPAERAFDVVGAFDVLEHIEEDEHVLRAMHRALRPGGGIVVAVPQHPALWSAADELAHHVRRYRRGELEAKAGRSGFRIVFSGSYNVVLLPLMALSRLRAARSGSEQLGRAAVDAEFAVAPALNSVLTAMLQAEVSLTLLGLRFPLGGSRFVVAVKGDVAA